MSNNVNENLKLSVLLDKVDQLRMGAITIEELNEWGQELNIRTSIPMLEKMSLMMRLVNDTGYDMAETQEINVCELEGYLGVSINKEDMTYINYDKLEPIFGPWIESFVEHDIKLFKNMLRDTITFYNAVNLDRAMANIDTSNIEQTTAENKALIEKLEENKQLVADLNKLMLSSNPKINKLIETIYTGKVKEVMASDAE